MQRRHHCQPICQTERSNGASSLIENLGQLHAPFGSHEEIRAWRPERNYPARSDLMGLKESVPLPGDDKSISKESVSGDLFF